MSIFKTTLLATAIIFSSATVTAAQDAVMDKAKDMAVDKGTDMAKDKAKDVLGDGTAQYVDPAAKVGTDMLKGDSAKDAVMNMGASEAKSMGQGVVAVDGAQTGAMSSTTLSTGEAVTAGKVVMKGGSAEDAAMAVAKDRAKDQMMDKAQGLVMEEVGSSTVVMDDAVVESSTVIASDPSGMIAPVQATVTTTTTPAVATINCPSGTTAQPDGSCLITGDYKE